MPTLGPDTLRNAFFVAAALFILFRTVRGWQLGIVRQINEIIALIAAYAAGYVLGPYLVPVLRPIAALPDPVLRALGGCAAGICAYFLVSGFGAVLFKRTGDQRVGLVRLLFGLSGAVVGLLYGVFLVLVALVAVRFLGTLAGPAKNTSAATPAVASAQQARPRWMNNLAMLKTAVDQSAVGSVVKQIDPVPDRTYVILDKVNHVLARPGGADRVFEAPSVQALASHPHFQALRDDRELTREAEDRNWVAMMKNQHVIQALNDPEILALLKHIDLEKTLDYALSKTGGAPPPPPQPNQPAPRR